ncbi:MAG: hypothetical protein AAGF12_08530 [Myxococcota bacterium]
MTRDIVRQILTEADGVSGKGDQFSAAEGHRLQFYLGQPGQAMVLRQVTECTLADSFAALKTKEPTGELFIDYEAVHAIGTQQEKEPEARRTGF